MGIELEQKERVRAFVCLSKILHGNPDIDWIAVWVLND